MISILDLFKIGIGPSSSHTVGPMVAAKQFLKNMHANDIKKVHRIKVTLFGSLASTGIGHGSDKAVLLGLMGCEPRTLEPDTVQALCDAVKSTQKIALAFYGSIQFDYEKDFIFDPVMHEGHPNTMHFMAYDQDGMLLQTDIYFSIGGGFILRKGEEFQERSKPPYVFKSAQELLTLCEEKKLSISEIMWRNELTWHELNHLVKEIDFIWQNMSDSIDKGLSTTGILPGSLKLTRRASKVKQRLKEDIEAPGNLDFFATLDWVNAWALAVNEENAAGGRIVTAPTNGAAGIIPAVMKFAHKTLPEFKSEHIREFLLTATAFGYLFKRNASISGAEVGCQGEVGSACAMAAAGLAAVLGGTPGQIENAAEIATEHNLGLTCDPVEGLVQVPCIERNAIAAVKAINAARMALLGDGEHYISFDKVVRTVRETGADMQSKYKETSEGGLAVNYTEC